MLLVDLAAQPSIATLRTIEARYHNIGHVAVFTKERHIAVATDEVILFLHFPELDCDDELGIDCESYDTE
jgi:hypothetical protein